MKFPDFWLADQINSLVTFFLDMQYFVCFYAIQVDWANDMTPVLLTGNQTRFSAHGIDKNTGFDTCSTNIYGIRPVIAIVPAMIRFWQCLRRYRDSRRRHPFLTNAGKYATTFFVVLFGTLNSVDKHEHGLGPGDYNVSGILFYFWILAYVVSTTYTFVWDVLQDWSLGDPKHQFLRQELIYPHKAYYYAAIASDVVLRFGWALNITLLTEVYDWGDVVICVTALLECARRFVWNFFRLENEHVNNCGEFRAVRDINLRPIPRQLSGESGAGNDDTILPKLNKAKRSVIQLFHLGVNNPPSHLRPSSARDLVDEERRMLANDVELAAVKHRNHLSKEI